MEEEVQLYIDETTEQMQSAIEYLEKELVKIRAGKANPSMLKGVKVNCYGSLMPINQLANVGTPDPKTIAIQPWDKNLIKEIEKAILDANLGFNPDNNGEIIRINVPVLTEERRKELVKQVKIEGENAKISVRNSRREANDIFRKLEKEGLSEDQRHDAEDEIQKTTNNFGEKIDKIVTVKEEEILTV